MTCLQNQALTRELEALRRAKDDHERELESANQALYNELTQLRAQMEAILKELQTIMDTKLGLELEIAAYRKLLEGEERRFGRVPLLKYKGRTNVLIAKH